MGADARTVFSGGETMEEFKAFIRSRQRVNLTIVALNIVVFIVLSILGDTEDSYFMLEHGADFAPLVAEGEYYRLVTSMFLHFGVEHLFSNMLVLLFLGDTLEQTVGKLRYLIIYLLGGVTGNVVSVWFGMRTGDFAVSAGASGAVFAVIGALIWLVIRNRGRLGEYSGRRLVMMAVLSVLQGLTAGGVDNCAHIGGVISGFVLAFVLCALPGSGRGGRPERL